ncbi:hypothetical protein SAMN04487931_102315 [Desulfobacula phenolica]|uniref:Uncharacterized protein n=1 Tax=Desulfobacula phenolica TaxID=90732 RepID=A0A1H2DY02_9BACT|nr:hypothetical protein SAMN04487931_102315 [Desulfobacula phenolica]
MHQQRCIYKDASKVKYSKYSAFDALQNIKQKTNDFIQTIKFRILSLSRQTIMTDQTIP